MSNIPISLDIQLSYKGLIRRLDYQYVIESEAANWPIVILPSSGMFSASSRTGIIEAQAIFCPNTGSCPDSDPDVMPYNLQYSNGVKNTKLFANVRAKIFEVGSQGSDAVYSKSVLVRCDDCVQQNKPAISMPLKLSMNATFLALSDWDTGVVETSYKEYNLTISNLSVGDKYLYIINKEFTNWPIDVFPSSGSIVAQNTSINIPVSVRFCKDRNQTSQWVPLDVDGGNSAGWAAMMSQGTISASTFDSCDPQTDMLSILRAELFSEDINEPSIISNTMLVRCDKCISVPTFKLETLNLNSTDSVDVPIDLRISVSGISNDKYSYTIEGLKADWPYTVVPASGNLYVFNNMASFSLKGLFCDKPASCPPGWRPDRAWSRAATARQSS